MNRLWVAGAGSLALLAAALAGCQQPRIDISEMMKAPPRPAELARLDRFVGTWEGQAEMSAPGSDKVVTSNGVNTVSWEADGWVLVEHLEVEMGQEGGKMTGVGLWTWDPQARKYRTWWFDNYGAVNQGTASYDEGSDTWRMKGKAHYAGRGKTTAYEGTSRMIDDDTITWEYTEWASPWKLNKLMHIKGTSHRR